MSASIFDNRKRGRGRPRTNSTLVGVRLTPDLLDALDRWRLAQPDQPGRPEAVRRLLAQALNF
jgi:hypothetical protein